MELSRTEPVLEPGRRGDYQAALIASTMAEIHRDEKKRSRPFELEDFLLEYGAEGALEQSERDVEHLKQRIRHIFGAAS